MSLTYHEVTSENKDTAYVATVLLFNNIQQMAASGVGGWELVSTLTDNKNKHYKTRYSNGKMFVGATTFNNSHIYYFGEESEK